MWVVCELMRTEEGTLLCVSNVSSDVARALRQPSCTSLRGSIYYPTVYCNIDCSLIRILQLRDKQFDLTPRPVSIRLNKKTSIDTFKESRRGTMMLSAVQSGTENIAGCWIDMQKKTLSF